MHVLYSRALEKFYKITNHFLSNGIKNGRDQTFLAIIAANLFFIDGIRNMASPNLSVFAKLQNIKDKKRTYCFFY